MKPLLTRIDEELAICTDPFRRAELLGERGCYLARVGEFGSARQLLARVREDIEASTRERVVVRLMLLEGLLLFFEKLDIQCRDRIFRAHRISLASGHLDLAQLSAAWLAHIDFDLGRIDRACQMLVFALQPTAAISDAAVIRARMVLANLNMLGRRVDDARKLYDLAWRGAVLCGDDSAIAATFYNRANMLINHCRIGAVLGEDSETSRRFLELEVRSVDLYHQGSRQSSLAHLLESLDAMVLLNSGQLREAADKLRGILSRDVSTNINSDNAIPSLELALCLLSLGEIEEAGAVLASIGRPLGEVRALDDDLILSSLRFRAEREFGVFIKIDSSDLSIDVSIEKYRSRLSNLNQQIDEINSALGLQQQ